MEQTFLEIIKQFGPWVALCVYFIWQSWVRESALSTRLSTVEDYTRTTLQQTLAANTKALNNIAEMCKSRPCWAEAGKQIDKEVSP